MLNEKLNVCVNSIGYESGYSKYIDLPVDD